MWGPLSNALLSEKSPQVSNCALAVKCASWGWIMHALELKWLWQCMNEMWNRAVPFDALCRHTLLALSVCI